MKRLRTPYIGRQILFLLTWTLLVATGCSVNNNSITGNCNNAGGNNSLSCSSEQSVGASAAAVASATGATAAPAVPNGKLLGSYSVILSNGKHVPIGPTHPLASQISATGAGDIMFNTFSDVNTLYPISPYSSIAPFTTGGVPTYQGCLDDTDEQPYIGAGQGTAFCLHEQNLLVGGVITYIDQASLAPDSVTVMITVWSNAS